jgi:hypothetical protein
MKNLVNLNDFEINRESAKMMLENNSEFRMTLENSAFDNECFYIKEEYLDLLPTVKYNIDFCKTSLSIGNSDVYDLLYDIISESETWIAHLDDVEILMQKMETFRNMMGNIAGYSYQYERLENRATKLIEEFLEILEKHLESIIDGINDDYIVDDILNSCFDEIWSGIYINPKTFELYELKHL